MGCQVFEWHIVSVVLGLQNVVDAAQRLCAVSIIVQTP